MRYLEQLDHRRACRPFQPMHVNVDEAGQDNEAMEIHSVRARRSAVKDVNDPVVLDHDGSAVDAVR